MTTVAGLCFPIFQVPAGRAVLKFQFQFQKRLGGWHKLAQPACLAQGNHVNSMKIQPYKYVDTLELGKSTPADCISLYKTPKAIRMNRENEDEYHDIDFILRFDATSHRLRECTLLPRRVATIFHDKGSLPVTWDQPFLVNACQIDGAPVEAFGFVILRKLGIAITGLQDGDVSQLALTVFSTGDFDEFMSEATVFKVRAAQ